MTRYYRVRQDTFMWDKGAILKYNSNYGSQGGYQAISDIWDACDLTDEYISTPIIEKNPEWFERVYEVTVLGKAKYLAKDAAKKAHDALYKEK